MLPATLHKQFENGLFEEHDEEFKMLPWSPNSSGLNPTEHLWDSPIHHGSASQMTRLEGTSAGVLVPDTSGHLQGSWIVRALMVRRCFGGTWRSNIRLVVIMFWAIFIVT